MSRICRNCHEGGGDLIKPCRCSGNLEWVHRDCLNTWRSISPNRSSFSRCDICGEHYYMRKVPLGAGPYVKMIFGMIRDILLVVLGVVVLIVVPGAIIAGVEAGTHIMETFVSDSGVNDVLSNPVFDIFALGTAFDCFIIGLCAIFYGIAKCLGKTCRTCCCFPVGEEAPRYYTYDTYSYRSTIPPWWWWYVFMSPPRGVDPCCCCCLRCCCDCCCDSCDHTVRHHHHHHGDCDCSNCDCRCNNCDCNCKCKNNGSGGDAGAAAILVLVVIVIIIMIIGFFVGVIFLSMLTLRIIVNHVTILQKQKDAQELEVMDLSKGLAKDDPNIVIIDDDYYFAPAPADQGSYVAPESAPLVAAGYPEPPVMTAGAGPTAPPVDAYAPVDPSAMPPGAGY